MRTESSSSSIKWASENMHRYLQVNTDTELHITNKSTVVPQFMWALLISCNLYFLKSHSVHMLLYNQKHLFIDVSIQYSYIPYIEHRTGLLLR